MFDLSDIGGPKAAKTTKPENRVVLLCPVEPGVWQEIDVDNTTAEEFMEAIDIITAGGLPVSELNEEMLSTSQGRRRAIDQISSALTFPIVIPQAVPKR